MEDFIVYYLENQNYKGYKYSNFLYNKLIGEFENVFVIPYEDKDGNQSVCDLIAEKINTSSVNQRRIIIISNTFFGPFGEIKRFINNNFTDKNKTYSLFKTESNLINGCFICTNYENKDNLVKSIKESDIIVDDVNQANIYNLVTEGKLPFIPLNFLCDEYENVIESSTGEYKKYLLDYLVNSNDYSTEYIYEYLCKNVNLADMVYNMHLLKVLPDVSTSKEDVNSKVALVLHIYYEDMIEECFNYARSVENIADVYITTDTTEKLNKAIEVFKKGEFNKVEGILIENRGRDVSALLTGFKEHVAEYDLVCFAHDKKVTQLSDKYVGMSFSDKCYKNILNSKDFVLNIIRCFERDKSLGMMFPTPPNNGDYYPTLGFFDWGSNYENVKELSEKLGLDIDIRKEKEAIAPLGTMFWFRPDALYDLYKMDWKYKDYPAEPNGTDGTLLHAIERIYAYCAQNRGYYSSWLMNEEYSESELINLYFMIKEINKRIFEMVPAGKHFEVLEGITKFRNDANSTEGQLGYYKKLEEETRKSSEDNMKVAKLYMEKFEDISNTLKGTQEMVQALDLQRADYKDKLSKMTEEKKLVEQERDNLLNELNQIKQSKLYKIYYKLNKNDNK